MCREREVCTNRCDSGALWEICGQFVGKEGEGGWGSEREVERERGKEGRVREMERGGESERGRREMRRGRILWALGGNLCLAFEGWVSYSHSFEASQKG